MRRLRERIRRSTRTDVAFGLVTGAILFMLCAAFALSTPIGSAPDEPAHIIRAASVVRGDPGGAMSEIPSPGPGLPNQVIYDVTLPRSYAAVGSSPVCYAFKPHVSASCATPLPDDDVPTATTTYVGSYPPLFYALTGIPSLFLPADTGVFAMRLIVAALASALLAIGMVSARRCGGGLLVSIATLVITPMTIYLSGTVNPSSVEIAAGFAAWLAAIDLLRSADGTGSRLPVVTWTIAAAVLVASRPSGLFVLGVIAVCVAVALATRQNLRVLLGASSVRVAGAVLLIVTLATAGWILHARSFGAFVGTPIPGLRPAEMVEHVMTSHGDYAQQMVGVFGWLDAPAPDLLWWVWTAAAIAVALAGLVLGTGRLRLALGSALVVGVLAPPLTQITNAARYGYIWSGRYQLPYAMGLVLLGGLAVTMRRSERGSPWPRAIVPIVRAVIGLLVAGGIIVAYVIVMQRFGTGVVSGRFDYLANPEWSPPLNTGFTTVAVALGAGGWALWTASVAPASTADDAAEHSGLAGSRDR